jgi:YD repeat-containing protein
MRKGARFITPIRPTKVTDVLGNETDYTYDPSGRLTSKALPNGRIVTVTYNHSGYIESVKDQDGIGKEFEYAYDEGKKEYYAIITEPGGKVTEKWFDNDGSLLRKAVNGATVSKTTKDGRNKIIEGPGGKITRKFYDEWQNLTKIVYPDESTVTYEYDPRLKVMKKATNALGVVTTYEHDAKGNLTRMIEAFGTESERITEYTSDEYGNRETIKSIGDSNTEEAETVIEYDQAGNMIWVTDPAGNRTAFTHDIVGNILTITDAVQQTWQYEYDAAGRLIKQIDPLGNETEYVYDAVGNKIKEIDPKRNETNYEYDLRNNLIQITDAAGNSTIFTYNAAGKLVKRTDPEGKIKTYEYDSYGRMINAVDGNGNEIAAEYDDIISSGCSSCSGSGRISKVVYPTFTKEFRYDRRDRRVKEIDILGQGEQHITSLEYDAAGNLASKTDAENNRILYGYDSMNRHVNVRDALNQETEIYYDYRGNLIRLKDPKGQQTRFEYDKSNRVVREIKPMAE